MLVFTSCSLHSSGVELLGDMLSAVKRWRRLEYFNMWQKYWPVAVAVIKGFFWLEVPSGSRRQRFTDRRE